MKWEECCFSFCSTGPWSGGGAISVCFGNCPATHGWCPLSSLTITDTFSAGKYCGLHSRAGAWSKYPTNMWAEARGLWWAGAGSTDGRLPATPRREVVGHPTGVESGRRGRPERLITCPLPLPTRPHQSRINCFTRCHGNRLPKAPWVEGPC